MERESLTLGGCPVTKQDQSSGERPVSLVSWGYTLTSAHLDLGTWVSEVEGQDQVKGKEVEELEAGEKQETEPFPPLWVLLLLSLIPVHAVM